MPRIGPRENLIEDLQNRGVRGVLLQMAKGGQLLDMRCEMPNCYCPKGRAHFVNRGVPLSDWAPNPDHYPILKSVGGKLRPDNVRLAHVLCNRRDYGWRMRIKAMLARGLSLDQIAEGLNRKRIAAPLGKGTWSASTVRKAYVS